jgi:hypothetical protein
MDCMLHATLKIVRLLAESRTCNLRKWYSSKWCDWNCAILGFEQEAGVAVSREVASIVP